MKKVKIRMEGDIDDIRVAMQKMRDQDIPFLELPPRSLLPESRFEGWGSKMAIRAYRTKKAPWSKISTYILIREEDIAITKLMATDVAIHPFYSYWDVRVIPEVKKWTFPKI